MKRFVIIVAAGKGRRMSSDIPKQFMLLGDKPILMHTISNVYGFDRAQNIILILDKEYFAFWDELCIKHKFDIPLTLIEGGKERFYSVKNGLEAVEDDAIVAIHDGVRPFVSREVWINCMEVALTKGNAISAITPKDSIRIKNDKETSAVNRNNIYLVQTPQCFHSTDIKKAYQQLYRDSFTDDIQVLETFKATHANIVDGNKENIKITDPFDMLLAKQLLLK
ncbi:MAG: 2-C-methyl-D-erythritol 4-phosphate cytidylyltransferase [Bacteroidales bacterium]|jgi:2-C-methyl-D-erythritol 4-phosphate cytidylyltransferase|nr:2-C-methyl-D-erythritol 4-phosphate cytidylyltransferase [Bacteroidales bacterium]